MSVARERAIGVGVALGGHLVALPLLAGVDALLPDAPWSSEPTYVALFAPGLTQWVWVVPAALFAVRAKRPQVAWAALIAAGIVFLLNTACFGAFLFAFSDARLR